MSVDRVNMGSETAYVFSSYDVSCTYSRGFLRCRLSPVGIAVVGCALITIGYLLNGR